MINTYIGLWLNGYAGLDDTLVYQAVHQFQHGIYS
jgi:TetR/AcrR family transcriptional regulator